MPGSRGVCFVCGSLGAELRLHSKARDKGPYFPFLEHHEPPKGCRLPGPEGVVDSCRVCYAFLTQQWETYERSKTPALKRLYWLKRTDELNFTGAEMKLQGEYMAQVMGLQYQASCFDCSAPPLSPEDRRTSSFSGAASRARDSVKHSDTSVPPDGTGRGGTPASRSGSRQVAQSNAIDNQAPRRMRAAEPEGALDLSVPSKPTEISSETRPPSNKSNATNFRDLIVCFTCGCEMYVMNSKVVSSVRVSTSEPYFPFLEKITPLKGAVPLSREHLTRVCEACFLSAYQQWIAYERACTPTSARMYRIKDKYFSDSSNANPTESDKKSSRVRVEECCYLCGQVKSPNQIVALYTVPPGDKKRTMYFPFIRELRRPHGAQPLNPDGTVLVCTSCNGNLKTQWQHYERDSVPLLHRRYSLLPVSSASVASTASKITENKNGMPVIDSRGQNQKKSNDRNADIIDITQPLNIQISKSPVMSSNTAHGLLAIAPQTPRTISGDISSSSNQTGMVLSELASSGLNPKNSDLPRGTGHTSSGSGTSGTVTASVPHPLQQATTLPKKVCFLCGEKCLLSKSHLLFSYPVRHEAKSTANTQSPPFFPFLNNKDPALGSDPMTDEGTVISCNYCYFSLISQWKDFEESKNPADSNRWLRKYSVRDFICYICGLNVTRRKIRTLEVQKFHFLKEHKAPSGALILDGGEAVATCDACTFSLTHQCAEYERMGVPQELRKYNWTSVPASEENSQDNFDQGGEERWRRSQYPNEDSNLSVNEHAVDDEANTGLGQGSKPLALSMLSPASGGKMTPKTATVPPLSQGSPSNGLSTAGSKALGSAGGSTASFAAALRKLAHQAKDPQEEAATLATAKHNGSPINSGSPRSTTPKRAPPPPPLLYTSQTSTLNSPPVVTIAPTQTISHSTDGRQSNDRVPSAHSTASSYDHYNTKHERDQRPHSSHSRDDDRASSKDNAQTPTRLGAPSTSAGTSREDSLSRGFHPYRPDDDLHRAAAAAASLPPYALDPAFAAYHPAFLQHHAAAYQSALRLEEMSAMERFRLMQGATPSFLPFTAGLVPHHAIHPLLSAGARYAPDLLHQFPFISPGSAQAIDARTSQVASDRSKSEDDRLQELEREKEREKEKREKELEKEREREREAELIKREKQREAEREKQRNAEQRDRKDNILSVPSRFVSEREGERDNRAHHHHHNHVSQQHHHHSQQQQSQSHQQHHAHSVQRSEQGKGGSISQGTPRDHDTSHSAPPRSRTSDAAHDKNHYLPPSSSSHRNHDHYKYENHSLPKTERQPTDLSRHTYQHPTAHSDHSKGQPPPLISPHKSSSKGGSENAIFRPFENESAVSSVPTNNSDKTYNAVSALTSQLGVSSSGGRFNHVRGGDKESLTPSSLPSSAPAHNSGKDGKLHSNFIINHRIEKFDFKSLARECSSRERVAATAATSELVSKPSSVVETENKIAFSAPPPLLSSLPSVTGVKVTDSAPVSRLDARERLLSKARAEGRYNSESEEECELEEEEERKRERLLVVGSTVPTETTLTPRKVALMESLKLVTRQRKSDLQEKLFRKRRRLLREPSISPVELEDNVPPNGLAPREPLRTLPLSALPPEKNPKEKLRFFLDLQLAEILPEQRREKEEVRRVCEDMRKRREEKATAKVRRKLVKEQQELLRALNRGSCNNNKRKYDEMASDSSSALNTTIEPFRVSLGQLQERHLAAARLDQEKQQQRQQQQANHVQSGGVSGMGSDASRAVLFPEGGKDRQLSREFAEQFHESVLQSTRQKEHLQKLGVGSQPDSSSKPVQLNNHAQPSTASPSAPTTAPFAWPGIEKVYESFMHYNREKQAEKKMLLEKCYQLHAENVEYTKAADALYGRIEILREEERRQVAQREQLEENIRNLKKCLHLPR